MAGLTVAILLLISLFLSASGAYLHHGSTRLYDTLPNVTMTVGRSDAVFCLQLRGPMPTAIQWYAPQGQLVSRKSRDGVHQLSAGAGRAALLNFKSYQQDQGGKYECRVVFPGKNMEKLPVCIGSTDKGSDDEVTSAPPTTSLIASDSTISITSSTDLLSEPSTKPSSQSLTMPALTAKLPSKFGTQENTPSQPSDTPTSTASSTPTASPSPTAKPSNKVEGVRVTPRVQDAFPSLEVAWQPVAGPGVTYTIKYSTDPGEVNTPPEGALEEVRVSGTFTILTALERATAYYIWVMGVSKGVEGPPSDRMRGVTYNTLGPVSELSYEERTDTSVTITWAPPKEPNGGAIAAYFVEHGLCQNESTTSVRIDARQPMRAVIEALEPGVPYSITVRASTAAGKGEPVSVTVFTVQQAPTAQVCNVTVKRISNRTAIVSWSPLTLRQARGFPLYIVTFGAFAPVGRMTRAVNTTNSNVTIDELEPMQNYWFSVDVATAGGLWRGTLGAVITILPRVEAERDYTLSTDSSILEVGALLGGVVVGALGMLLIVSIVVGAIQLRRTRHMSSPSGKAVGEGVPMDANPAYGEAHIYDTIGG